MKIIAFTQKGPLKIENEDRIIVGKSILSEGFMSSNLEKGILAIADGVGGNKAGAVASHSVACQISQLDEITNEAVDEINERILELSQRNEQYSRMATTLSGIQINDKLLRIFHVGNTRVYAFQNGKYLKLLTSDDTTMNYLLSIGQITYEEAKVFERKNEITACIGGGSKALFNFKISDISNSLAPGFLLTSDGIHDYVSEDDIEDIYCECGMSEETCKRLVMIARDNGSSDDISLLFVNV